MTQEDKKLLLKDLCSRLPYGVKICYIYNGEECVSTIEKIDAFSYIWDNYNGCYHVKEIKPYLFPLSSMTEEQKRELKDLLSQETKILIEQFKNNDCGIDEGKYHFIKDLELDWLLENHFDFRGLIPKNLANDATGLNIY